MTIQSPSQIPTDPYQLNRLADELATREAAVSTVQNGQLSIRDLPVFVPLSHDNPFLSGPNFNVEDFLLSRSNTSLSDLRSELREYLSLLKEELVKLINDDYEAFISLSTDLKDEGGRLLHLKSPLQHLKLQIFRSRTELHVIQDAIQEKLTKRALLREEKTLLHLLLKLSESVTRLESLLLITSPGHEPSGPSDVKPPLPSHVDSAEESTEFRPRGNRAKHLGRVAAEYMQLLYHTSKARAERCVFVDEIQWRIDRIQSTISSDLDHVFATTLVTLTDGKGEEKVTEMEKSKLLADVTECLKTYDILRLWRDAEDVLKKEVVRGFVKKTLYPGALAAPHSPIVPHTPYPASKATSYLSTPFPRTPYTPFSANNSARQSMPFSIGSTATSPYFRLLEDTDDPLARLYSQALRFVERDLSRIMNIAEAISMKSPSPSRLEKDLGFATPPQEHSVEGFEIMANVVWEEFGRALIDELGGIIFASGRPNEFRKHRELTQAFVRSLEYLAPSAHSIKSMRAHPVYIAFEQRWQLPVYFQIRWKEIVGSLEESFSVARIEPIFSGDKTSFVTSQAHAVWVAITACWSAEVFIPELCYRFWRLTLQILSRYKTWLNQTVSSRPSAGHGVEKTLSPSRASTPVQNPDTTSAEAMAADDAALRQNVAIMADIRTLRIHLLTLWQEEISVMLPESVPDENSGADAQETLQSIISGLASLVSPLSNEVIDILTKRCCDALLPARSIPSQFRAMSNKRTPTEPSYFVTSILRPLKLFFGIGIGDGIGLSLGEDYIQPYSMKVFDNVVQRYIYYLTAMKKTEESLRRLKKGKKPAFSLFGSANTGKDDDSRDEERIRIQMIIDVEAFGSDAESLGVIPQSSEAYGALKDMVHALEAPDSS